MQFISDIRDDVERLLAQDTSGHGMEHVDRVFKLAMAFANDEGADENIVALAALLHDVDDYKLFGQQSADHLTNATNILDKYDVDEQTKDAVLAIIRSMGYNKYLEGIRPATLEGMIVSDADMCDAIGAIGILRTHAYALSKGNEFFDKSLVPEGEAVSAAEYRSSKKSHSAQHFFDKLLKIPGILMTESGRREGRKRKAIMTDFLEQLFAEEDAEVWQEYLRAFDKAS